MNYFYEGMVLLAVFFVLSPLCYVKYAQLTNWLKNNDQALWQRLGQPEWRNLFFWGLNFNFGLGRESRQFTLWLLSGRFSHHQLPHAIIIKLNLLRFCWALMLLCFGSLLVICVVDVLALLF